MIEQFESSLDPSESKYYDYPLEAELWDEMKWKKLNHFCSCRYARITNNQWLMTADNFEIIGNVEVAFKLVRESGDCSNFICRGIVLYKVCSDTKRQGGFSFNWTAWGPSSGQFVVALNLNLMYTSDVRLLARRQLKNILSLRIQPAFEFRQFIRRRSSAEGRWDYFYNPQY